MLRLFCGSAVTPVWRLQRTKGPVANSHNSRIEQAKGIDPFHADWLHWDMGWAL